MTWRTWDQWLADATQSGGVVVSRTDNGTGPAAEVAQWPSRHTGIYEALNTPDIYSTDPTEDQP